MRYKRITYLLILVILSICISSAVSAQDLNATDEIEIADDNELETIQEDAISATYKVSGNTFADIQNVVDNAKTGDTISLSGKYTGSGEMIKINKQLTIEGNAAVLDAASSSKIFEITGKHVSVNNITFTNGKSASAGAIDWWSGTKNGAEDSYGVLTNCKFIDCYADYYAGAVYFFDNKLTMRNCYFQDNSATKGGAVYVMGSGCVIEDCEFKDNSAQYGGAVLAEGDASITNCKFTDNDAAKYGGAIYISSTNATISKSDFKANTAPTGKNIYIEDYSRIAVKSCSWDVAYTDDFDELGIYGSVDEIEILSTTVSVASVSGLVKSTQTITATVRDSLNNPVSSGSVEFVIDGKKYTGYVENGKAAISYELTAVGTYTGTARFIASGIYETSATSTFKIQSKANNVKFTSSGLTTYYNSREKFNVKVTGESDGAPAQNVKVAIDVYTGNNYKTYTETSNANGIATFDVGNLGIGTHKVVIRSAEPSKAPASSASSSITVNKLAVKLTPTALTTTYASGTCFKIKVVNSKTNKAAGNVKLTLKVYTGKKYKTFTVTSDSNGYAKYNPSTLAVGTHKIVASAKDSKYITATAKKSSVKITQATLQINAAKVTNEYKKSQTFKVTVKNKKTSNPMKGVKVTIKVQTGSAYKTYTVKTDSKGVASINTKDLSKGAHNVIVNVKKTGNYKAASAKSAITIIKEKLATAITIDSCYRYSNNAIYHIEATLKDSKGNKLANKELLIETLVHLGALTTSQYTTATTDSNGQVEGDINAMMGGISTFDITVYFEGDNSYYGSASESRHLA